MTVRFDSPESTVGQYVYSFAWDNQLDRSWSTSPLINVLPQTPNGRAFEPCRTLYAYSLADDTEQTLGRGCVEEAQLVPERFQLFPLDDKLAIEHCMQPPADLQQRWCEINRPKCQPDAKMCPGYEYPCRVLGLAHETPAAAGAASPPPESSAAAAGCSVARGRGSSEFGLWWVASLVLARARRRCLR